MRLNDIEALTILVTKKAMPDCSSMARVTGGKLTR